MSGRRHIAVRTVMVTVAFTLAAGLGAVPSATAATTPGWLARLNAYRTRAGVLPVEEVAGWSYGERLHAKYMVNTGDIRPEESTSSQFYTRDGRYAAQRSSVLSSTARGTGPGSIDEWMTNPFEALPLLHPRMRYTAFGEWFQAEQPKKYAASIWVLKHEANRSARTYPVLWPAPNAGAPRVSHTGGEYPNILEACPGYVAPTGIPIIAMLAPKGVRATAASPTLRDAGGNDLEVCLVTPARFGHSNPADPKNVGYYWLTETNAVVIMPREPLLPSSNYAASLVINGRTVRWNFSTHSTAT